MNKASIRNLIVSSASSLAVATIAMSSQVAFAQANQANQPNEGLADIIVTAQKREEKLQNIPVAVTALNTAAIENAQVKSFTDLNGLAPNLTVGHGSSAAVPIITLRGIVGYNLASGTDSPIATYLNGVYLPRLLGASFDAADLERVEILRGPQGTLYGKNSTGGAINFITAKPKGEFYARQEVTVGNYGRLRTKTRVDLPKIGAFSVSGTFVHDEINGYVNNSQPGLTRDYSLATRGFQGIQTSPKKFGENNSESGLVAVSYAPDSLPLKADYTFLASNATNSPSASQTLEFQPFLAPLIAFQPLAGGSGVASLTRLDTLPGGFTGHEHLTTWAHMLNVSLELPGDVQLKSITGYHGFRDNLVTDLTENGALRSLSPGTFGQPFVLLASTIAERSKNFSQEFQLTYDHDWISLIGGLYYSHEHTISVTPTYITQELPLGQLPNGSTNAFNYNDADATNSSRAVFAQGTVHFNEKLDLTGGLRYTNDKRATVSRTVLTVNGVRTPVGDFAKTFNNVSWTTNLSFRPSDGKLVYAKVGTGYLSGGVFDGFAFDPEKVTQYEVGTKVDLLDRRLRINAAAFYSDYKNQQIGQNNAQFIYVFQNAAKATIKGIELEVTAAPTHGLILTANYGYTDYKYKHYLVSGVDLAGTIRPTHVPKHTVALGGEYTAPAIAYGIVPSLNVDAKYHSKINYLPSPTYSAAADAAIRNNDYWDINARASLAKIPVGRLEGKVSVWTQNLLNKKKVTDGTDLGLAAAATFGRGRTVGADFAVQF
jgi:iron complex outermembrane receptor protein